MRRGAVWMVERHQVAAWSLPWLRSRWQCCHCRASLGLPSRKRRPHSRGLGVSRRAAFVVMAIEDVRLPSVPFIRSPVRIASGSAGVPGGGDGVRPGYDRAGGVRKAVRSWRPLWTPDTGPGGRWTGTRLADVRASSMVAGGHAGWVPVLVAAGISRREHAHCRPVRSGPG
jgi:hypothetical protein